MQLLGKHKYQVENNLSLSSLMHESLVLMYQPLIGAHALSLYLFLYHFPCHTTYSEVCRLMHLSIEEVERAIIKLEQFQLIKTFKNQEDHYLHVLIDPLYPNDFLQHYVFGLELRHVLGNHIYNQYVEKYRELYINKSEYVDITERYQAENLDLMDEQQVKEVIQRQSKEEVLPTNFNYHKFLMDVTDLQFPQSLRTKENLALIAELALLYGISEERMRILVLRSIDFKNQSLNVDDLVQRVRYEEVNIDQQINRYDLPPVAFLQKLQHGAAVTATDKKLIEKLYHDMKLNPAVINRLIEHLMQKNNNVLISNYALKVAATWKAYDVKTVAEANKIIESTTKPRHKDVPASQPARKERKKSEKSSLSKADKSEILKKIQEMGAEHEESES